MAIRQLDSAADVVKALGGTAECSRLTGASMQSVSNWLNAGNFPSDLYALMSDELLSRGKTAPRTLWRQREAPARA